MIDEGKKIVLLHFQAHDMPMANILNALYTAFIHSPLMHSISREPANIADFSSHWDTAWGRWPKPSRTPSHTMLPTFYFLNFYRLVSQQLLTQVAHRIVRGSKPSHPARVDFPAM